MYDRFHSVLHKLYQVMHIILLILSKHRLVTQGNRTFSSASHRVNDCRLKELTNIVKVAILTQCLFIIIL